MKTKRKLPLIVYTPLLLVLLVGPDLLILVAFAILYALMYIFQD